MRKSFIVFEKSLCALSGDVVRRLDRLISDYAPPRLDTVFMRPFVQALLPLAMSSRVWRTGRLDGASGIYGVDTGLAISAISLSTVAARTPITFEISPASIQALGSRLLGRRQTFRKSVANVGRLDAALAPPGDVLRLLAKTTASLRKTAKEFPLGTAFVNAAIDRLVVEWIDFAFVRERYGLEVNINVPFDSFYLNLNPHNKLYVWLRRGDACQKWYKTWDGKNCSSYYESVG